MKTNVWRIVGAVLAIIVAFWLLNFVLHLAGVIFKLGIVVAIVAIAYFGARSLFRNSGSKSNRR